MNNSKATINASVQLSKQHFPTLQAMYLFGSHGTEDEWPTSDVDIALLLPHDLAKSAQSLNMHPLHSLLQEHFGKELDLINLRKANTVFQYEIITTGRVLYCGDETAVGEFEIRVFSFYQKLNEERAEIIEQGTKTGRFYDV